MKDLLAVVKSPKLLLLEAAGWALLLALGWWWLNLPEARPAHLALSAGVLVVMLAILTVLIARAFGRTLRQTAPWALLWVAGATLALFFVPGRPAAFGIAVLLLGIAAPFWAGGRAGASGLVRPVLWAGFFVFCVAGLLGPAQLLRWRPEAASFEAQTASLLARAGLGFALFVVTWTALGFAARRASGQLAGETGVEPAQHGGAAR